MAGTVLCAFAHPITVPAKPSLRAERNNPRFGRRRYGLLRSARNDDVEAATATKRLAGQITSDFQKSCQAQESIRIKNIPLSFSPKSAA
jgi:hypothetical protein